MTNTISMSEVKNILNYTIDNNKTLEDNGKVPIAIALEASAGIGKTSIVKQIANERKMGFVKLNLAQFEESGDLCGYPLTEYECQIAKQIKQQDGSTKIQIMPGTSWLNAKQIESMSKNTMIKQTGKTRMSYAKPAWVPEYNENGTILFLDDYVRANPQLLQACMDLILEQKYVSWSLPKHTTICLSNNPDDGNNNINSLDEAQKTRFMNYEIEWSQDAWAEWAETVGIDSRCINFVLSYSNELFNADEQGNRICNPRSFVMFANMISGIKDWDSADNLAFISTISKGCFKDESARFAQMFQSFIRNKMHLLISPQDMLLKDWDDIKDKMEKAVYDSNNSFRPDIASILERRFTNYVNAWLESDKTTPIAIVKSRILDFINTSKTNKPLFSKDQFYHMIKVITAKHKNQTNKLLFEPEIAAIIM